MIEQIIDKVNKDVNEIIDMTVEQRIKDFMHGWEQNNAPFLSEMHKQRLEENLQLRALLKEAIEIDNECYDYHSFEEVMTEWLTKARKILGEE